MICHYGIFNRGLELQDSICNGFLDFTSVNISVSISDIAIITIKNVDYHCTIHNISKSEETNLLENSVIEYRGCI